MQDTLSRDTALPAAAATAPRHDIYSGIHKALRLMFGDTLARIGSTDPADATALARTVQQTRELIELCRVHYDDENRFVHPALERGLPGSTQRIADEHATHFEALDQLGELLQVVEASRQASRGAALVRLYRALALFVAEDLEHMHYEDTELNAILWRHYSDEQLHALEAELVASIPPATMAIALRWMIPALNAHERVALLGGARQGMPPEAFAGVMEIARSALPAPEWVKLVVALRVVR